MKNTKDYKWYDVPCALCNEVTDERVYLIPMNVDIIQHIPKVHSSCKALWRKWVNRMEEDSSIIGG